MSLTPSEKCCVRIKKALGIRRMKQSELCELTGIAKSVMSEYVSGAYEPKQDRLVLISKVLGVDPVWLMGFDVPMESPEYNIRATKKDEKENPSELELTEAEELLLKLFRQIPADRQAEALELLEVALKMQKKR